MPRPNQNENENENENENSQISHKLCATFPCTRVGLFRGQMAHGPRALCVAEIDACVRDLWTLGSLPGSFDHKDGGRKRQAMRDAANALVGRFDRVGELAVAAYGGVQVPRALIDEFLDSDAIRGGRDPDTFLKELLDACHREDEIAYHSHEELSYMAVQVDQGSH